MKVRLRISRWGAACAVLAAFAIVSSTSYGLWHVYYRPFTPDEVLLHVHWKPGEVRDVEGVITEINYFNTTYGREVYLQLKGYWASTCNGTGFVRGDIGKNYVVGQTFKTTLHFEDYDFNNIRGVWARELVCPIPFLFETMAKVMDGISYVLGIYLAPKGMNETGWMSFEIVTRDRIGYPLNLVNVSLIKGVYPQPEEFPLIDAAAGWIVVAAFEYVALQGGYYVASTVDGMHSLEEKISRNMMMRYADANGNDLLDDGDRIYLHLEKSSTSGIQTYFLSLGGGMTDCGYICGLKYILEDADGPYEIVHDVNGGIPYLHHVGDYVGPNVTSTVEVMQDQDAIPIPIPQVNFTLNVKGRSRAIHGNVDDLPTITEDGITVDFSDNDHDRMLDAGDRFMIGGIANRTTLTFGIDSIGNGGSTITWIVGFGHVVGNVPRVSFSTEDTHSPLTIDLNVPWWHQELNLSRHLTVSVRENSTLVLDNIALTNGMIGSFPGGNLTFIDGDTDGFLSSGDHFALYGKPNTRYRFEVSVLWGYSTSVAEFRPI